MKGNKQRTSLKKAGKNARYRIDKVNTKSEEQVKAEKMRQYFAHPPRCSTCK